MDFKMRQLTFDEEWAGHENIACFGDGNGAVRVVWSLGDGPGKIGQMTVWFGDEVGSPPNQVQLHLPAGISSGQLSRFAWKRWLALATVVHASSNLRDSEKQEQVAKFVNAARTGSRVPRAEPVARRGRPGYGDDFYADVARRYYTALIETPRSPVRTMSRSLNVSISTVRSWVHTARLKGFLAPTTRGRAG
jgi:hypothetical protein